MGFYPMHFRQRSIAVIEADVNGLVNDGFGSGFYDGANHFDISLNDEFNDFVVWRF